MRKYLVGWLTRLALLLPLAPAVTMAAAAEESHVLGKFQISAETGAILGGADVLKACRDQYIWEGRSGTLTGNENSDQVRQADVGPDRVVLDCFNPETQLNIRKSYELVPGRDALRKTVEFTGPEGFVSCESSVKLQPKFRNAGYYHKPVWHSGDPTRIPARSISRPLPMVGVISCVLLVNPDQDRTIAVYRDAVDGHPVFPYGGVGYDRGLILNRDGWQQANALAAIGPEQPASVAVVYEIRPGDELDFYLDFVGRDAIAALRGTDAVGWPERLIGEGGWDLSYLNRIDQLVELSRRMPWGSVYAWTLWGWFAPYYGDYAATGADAAPGTADPADTGRLFRELRAKLPQDNIKFGCYVLPGAISRSAKIAGEHPEWFDHDRDGAVIPGCYADYAPEDPTGVYSLRRGALEHWQNRIDGMLHTIGADYLYIDGGIAGAVVPDWNTMSCDQDYDWYALWESFQTQCQEAGGMLWSNQSASVYNDGGYHEFNWYPVYADDWRRYADRVKTAVIFRGPDRRVGLVGYVWNGKPDHPATRLQINSYFVHNTFPAFLDAKGDDHFPALLHQLPYMLAAYELFPSAVAAARVTPDWRDADTEVEVQAYEFAGGGRLGILSHAAAAVTTTVTVATADLGLKPAQGLYVWRHRLIEPGSAATPLAGPARIDRIFDTALVEALPTTPEELALTITVAPELAEVVILTPSPALLTMVDGQELPLPLPAALGIQTKAVSNASDRRLNLSIDSPEFAGQAVVLLPEYMPEALALTIQPQDGAGATVAAGPRPLEFETVEYAGQRAVKIAFPVGRHTVVIAPAL